MLVSQGGRCSVESISTQIKMNVLNKVDLSLLGIRIIQPVAMPLYKTICLCYSSLDTFL